MRHCPNCGNQVSDKAVFCDQCGSRLPEPEPAVAETVVQAAPTPSPAGGIPEDIVLCASCGAENVPGEVFCDVCGEPLESPQPAEQTVIQEAVIEEAVIEEAVIEEAVIEEAAIEEAAIEENVVEEPVAEEVIIEEIVEEIVQEPEIPETQIEQVVEIVETAAPEVEAVPAASMPAASGTYCPVCGASTRAGDTFCGSCGAALGGAAPAATAAPAAQPIPSAAPTPAAVVEEVVPIPVISGPYLQVKASGAHIPLTPQPELLVGRLDEVSGIEPEVDMTPHGGLDGGVSRRHAKLICEGKTWFVLDLDSTNGTFINGIEVKPRVRTPIKNGDHINFGDIELVFFAG